MEGEKRDKGRKGEIADRNMCFMLIYSIYSLTKCLVYGKYRKEGEREKDEIVPEEYWPY